MTIKEYYKQYKLAEFNKDKSEKLNSLLSFKKTEIVTKNLQQMKPPDPGFTEASTKCLKKK